MFSLRLTAVTVAKVGVLVMLLTAGLYAPTSQAAPSVQGHATTSVVVTDDAGRPMSLPESLRASLRPEVASPQVVHHFYLNAPSYSRCDNNGCFNAQVTISGKVPMAWSFRLTPKLQAIATSNVQENVGITRSGKVDGSYHDDHNEPADYLFHSTVPFNRVGEVNQLFGSFVFRVNAGGRTGTAHVSTTFDYEVG